MLPISALPGTTILDLTRLLPGPMATQWLADMGATVIKVEEPGAGDSMRSMPPEGLFEQINRGKKSVAVDLKSTEGLAAFLRLSEKADVLIEGFRPGVMNRLGCGWNVLRQRNPRLVYVALTGYGSESPYKDLAGHDINYLAMAGVLDLIGPAKGAPVIPGVQIADLAGGSMYAVIGVLSALLARQRTGEGCFVDISMTHGSAKLLPIPLAQLRSGEPPRRGNEILSGRYACYNLYRTADGRYVAVGALEPKFWAALCRALGCEQFIEDQFAEGARREEILNAVGAHFVSRGAEEWFTTLRHLDTCVTPVRTVAEAAADLGLVAKGGVAPRLGEHSGELLK
ncbi:MAG TPA: CaiB/BaiF CoA-transferase family protein [Bryobacteraceae bacterium]|nr:CaiB/BaiF CoA-transferase family protein [Bryobacteraceae bacterium]